ncbi:MAG: ChaN family lipoprotein [Desulfuromusa sp.]|nr:ChaN family lipoprotein [Desulfuromusa sp.]
MKIRYFFPLLVMMISLIGCQPASQYLGDPELPYPPDREPVIGDILHLPTGIYVDQQVMLDQASSTQVVFVGETHDNPASHRLQVEILQTLQQHNPDKITLAMEMFTPSQQPVLDLWIAGQLTEKDFLQQVDWYHNWRMNFAFYRPLLSYCREHKIPILALNAEVDLKHKVARTPLAELSAEEQQQLPDMDSSDPYQQAMVQAFFNDHKMGQTMLAGFQRVQTLWDETMAQNLADYLNNGGKGRQILVIAGGNHVRYGFGIPRRLFRRVPVNYLLIGSEELDIPEDKQDRLMNVIKPNYPMPPYHYLTFTEYEDLPNPGVKLGIMLDKTDGGLVVKGVVPGSIAEQNNLEEGDILTQIDHQILVQPFDLIYELQQKKPGNKIDLTLTRAGQVVIKTIVIPDKKQQ